MTGTNTCAMCGNRPADRGLLCSEHRAEDRGISARDSDAMLARRHEVAEPRSGGSAGRQASPERI